MNTYFILGQTVLFVILITDLKINEVEAGHKVVSLGNWFGSLEKVNLQNVEGTENTATLEKNYIAPKKRKSKKRKKVMRKDIEWAPEDDSVEVTRVNKKKHKKKLGKRGFRKTAVKEFNNSDSEERNYKGRKPVDIIVHIKMNE